MNQFTLNIEIPIDPTQLAFQSVRSKTRNIGGTHKTQYYQPAEKMQTKRYLKLLFAGYAKGLVDLHAQKNSCVTINKLEYRFPMPPSMPAKLQEIVKSGTQIVRKNTKPDLMDNMNKLLFDAMSKVLFYDDGRVCEANNLRKIYSVNPGITINLTVRW